VVWLLREQDLIKEVGEEGKKRIDTDNKQQAIFGEETTPSCVDEWESCAERMIENMVDEERKRKQQNETERNKKSGEGRMGCQPGRE